MMSTTSTLALLSLGMSIYVLIRSWKKRRSMSGPAGEQPPQPPLLQPNQTYNLSMTTAHAEQGWQCQLCRMIHAPKVLHCPCVAGKPNPQTMTGSTWAWTAPKGQKQPTKPARKSP